MDIIATSIMGLEAVVSRELSALGYENKIIDLGRILFQGDMKDICRANIWLRSAGRVLLRLGEFPSPDFEQLFERTRELPWHEWIPADGAFPVNGRSLKSQLTSVPACQRAVKKAIVEKLMAAHGVTQLDETGPEYSVEISLAKDIATLTIDTTGHGLHKRGYRRWVGKAPLRETLAAGLVQLSFWKAERPLVDPFCGSGTIPIEAALIGRNIAPGLRRTFAASDWSNLPAKHWVHARREAEELIRPNLTELIIGTDIDEESLGLARYHAEQAGVAEDIHFQQRDFRELSSKRDYGCVIANPPYARRMGEYEELEELYRGFPDVLRRLKTWSHFILTAYPGFERLVGKEADRRRKLFNSTIECTYFQYHGPRPGDAKRPAAAEPATVEPAVETSTDATPPPVQPKPAPPVQVQAFGGLSAKAHEEADIFARRLTNRARHLRRWPTKQGITCYRLYERDVPEIPLVVDRYEDYLHISEYERPHERSLAEHSDWLELMAKTAAKTLDIPRANTFLKQRSRQQGTEQHDKYADEKRTAIVEEGGLKFEVNFSDYVDTGLFLDHRITRSMVRDAVRGKRFLNMFAYTGAFTVYAADGPANSTVTVDWSTAYLDWARRNMKLNGFEGPQHAYVQADAMDFLNRHRPGPCYDVAVVDPPTFSNSKRSEVVWDVQLHYAMLLRKVIKLMMPGGVIYFSTNFRRFKLNELAIPGVSIREISRQTVPDDFRNQRIHRCWRMVAEAE